MAALGKGALERNSGKEGRAGEREVVGRVRTQRFSKPGDTGDGEGTGGNEGRKRGEECVGWEKRGQKEHN